MQIYHAVGKYCYAIGKAVSGMAWLSVALVLLYSYDVPLTKRFVVTVLVIAYFGHYWYGHREAEKVNA